MDTLSYGYKKPETGDRGSTFFTAMEDNIQRVNDHTHNGTDSPPLPAQSISGVTQSILAVNWVANGPTGFYRQLVTVASGFDFDKVFISFRLTASGDYVYPTVEKVSTTSYYVYINDNTVGLTAVYGG